MEALQVLSITTSTITIIFSIVRYIARDRRVEWIRPGFPLWASLLPICCLTLFAVLSGSITFRLFMLYMGGSMAHKVIIGVVFINAGSMLFTLFTLLISHRIPIWKNQIFRCAIHILLSGFLPATIIYYFVTDYDRMLKEIHDGNITSLFPFIVVCHFLHFLLGIIVFSRCKYEKSLTLVIFASVYMVRKMVVCCRFPIEWQVAINKKLDKVLKLESEHEEGREEEMEQDLQHNAVKNYSADLQYWDVPVTETLERQNRDPSSKVLISIDDQKVVFLPTKEYHSHTTLQ